MLIGKYLRYKIPSVYFFLTGIQNIFLKNYRPFYIYITDSLGDSFKSYINDRNLEELKASLVKGLDEESERVVSVVTNRMLFYPDESCKKPMDSNLEIVGGLLEVEEEVNKIRMQRFLNGQEKMYKLDKKYITQSVFYFYHGLLLMGAAAKKYIKDTDFVDIGAYVGDSAIALQKYNYKKIYSIEISKKSIADYQKNIAAERLSESKYELINVAISDKENLPDIKLPDTGSAGFSLMRERGKYDEIMIRQSTFDQVVRDYEIRPKFIKVDIEGYAMHFIKGGLNAIKEFRPIMSIAIYHNPIEFFEIKPFLEKELDQYSFCIRKMTSDTRDNNCHSEIILLAYPNEVLDKVSVL